VQEENSEKQENIKSTLHACYLLGLLAGLLSLITKFPSTIELPQKRDQVSCLHHHHFLLLLLSVLPIGSLLCIYELPLHLFFCEDARAEAGKVERERERERGEGGGGREGEILLHFLVRVFTKN